MGQYVLEQSFDEGSSVDIEQDPGYIAWANQQDDEDIEYQESVDEHQRPF